MSEYIVNLWIKSAVLNPEFSPLDVRMIVESVRCYHNLRLFPYFLDSTKNLCFWLIPKLQPSLILVQCMRCWIGSGLCILQKSQNMITFIRCSDVRCSVRSHVSSHSSVLSESTDYSCCICACTIRTNVPTLTVKQPCV